MGYIVFYHLIAFAAGFILDMIIGDPVNIPHPIRWIGSLISFLEKKLWRDEAGSGRKNKVRGAMLWLIVVTVTAALSFFVTVLSYLIHPVFGVVIESILTCYCLAAKSLKTESMKVYKALKTGNMEVSRKAVSMIVGRDTESLDEAGVAKAAVETVAENTSDGVIAPLLCVFLGGAVFGLTYKAINTMDSMIGYHNDRYENFGFFAAKADDVFNYIPSRLSAYLMILSCVFLGKEYDATRALRIFKRDRYNHKSPNSAQTESVCAGALGVRLAGDASYFGKTVKKPYIGDAVRPIETEDIKRANRLMYMSVVFAFILCGSVILLILLIL